MKTTLLATILTAALILPGPATVVSTGTFPYPVNMGPDADPNRIPVGLIPCESNHGYGLLQLIATPFPSVPGGWQWDGGTELNGNLPSAFGISMKSYDGTGALDGPVTIRLRKQSPPAYSPYTKEQVLLATLRCLLDAVQATPERPLTIQIVTDDPADAPLQRFSGKYLTAPVKDGDEFEPTPLPGCVTMVDHDGVREIVFTDEPKQAPPSKNPRPLWMPFPVEGDSDQELLLLPLWTGNGLTEDRLKLLGQPWPLLQDRFNPAMGNPDGNMLTRHNHLSHFRLRRSDDKTTLLVSVNLPNNPDPVNAMAMLCWAAILSERPTEAQPFELTLLFGKDIDPRFLPWVADHGWEEAPVIGGAGIRTTFAWDPDTGSLTKGTIPVLRVDRHARGGWEVSNREAYERAMKTAAERDLEFP